VSLRVITVFRANAQAASIHGKQQGVSMSDLKEKTKQKTEEAAQAVKEVTAKIVEKSKDVAHTVGKKMEEGGKRLQDA
jgi:hypothetical protein